MWATQGIAAFIAFGHCMSISQVRPLLNHERVTPKSGQRSEDFGWTSKQKTDVEPKGKVVECANQPYVSSRTIISYWSAWGAHECTVGCLFNLPQHIIDLTRQIKLDVYCNSTDTAPKDYIFLEHDQACGVALAKAVNDVRQCCEHTDVTMQPEQSRNDQRYRENDSSHHACLRILHEILNIQVVRSKGGCSNVHQTMC